MRRIAFFTQGTAKAASSRYRVYQFLPHLQSKGWSCRVYPSVPAWLHAVYFFSASRWLKALLSPILVLRRCGQLLFARAEIAFVQKPLLPPLWPSLNALLRRVAPVIVFDFDDAVFLNAKHPKAYAKRFSGALRAADLVLAGNAFLAREARKTAPNVEVFPTVLDTQRFSPKDYTPAPAPLTIGWMGSPTTAVYLKDIEEALKSLAASQLVHWKFVGAGSLRLALPHASYEDWREENEAALLQSMDIFLAPMRDTAWEQGKCGLKALAAMSAGLPVVASAWGVHRDIVQDGENGFLAHGPQDWREKLLLLSQDAGLRHSMGQRARQTVQQRFDLRPAAERLDGLLARLRGMPQA